MARDLPPTRRGYAPHEVVSALQKAIRRSDPEQSVYWAVELYESGYANWLWKRLRTICSEDIGPADRYLPAQIAALNEWSDKERPKGGGGMEMVHAVLLMASAEKSRVACWTVIGMTGNDAPRFEIPDEALDQHTRRGRQMKRSRRHFVDEAQKLIPPKTAAKDAGFDSMAEWMAELEERFEAQYLKRSTGSNPWRAKSNEKGLTVHRLDGPGEQMTLGGGDE